MTYTMGIDFATELDYDIRQWMHGPMLLFEFKPFGLDIPPYAFWLPDYYENLMAFLFDVSLSKTICHAVKREQVCAGEHYLSSYEFTLVDSTNHQTNITPEFMTAITRWKDTLMEEQMPLC